MDLKDIFVKASTNKPVEISKIVSTNLIYNEKVTSHKKSKKSENVFIKKTNEIKNDVKKTPEEAQKKKTGMNISLMTKGQSRRS